MSKLAARVRVWGLADGHNEGAIDTELDGKH